MLSPEPVKRDPARELEVKVLPDRSRICRNAWPDRSQDPHKIPMLVRRAIPYFEELSKFSKEREHEKGFLFFKLLFVAVLLVDASPVQNKNKQALTVTMRCLLTIS